jgi:hypothetical protein
MNPEDVVHHVCKSFDDFAARVTKREAPNNWDGLRDELCKWVSSVETDIAFDVSRSVPWPRRLTASFANRWITGDLRTLCSKPLAPPREAALYPAPSSTKCKYSLAFPCPRRRMLLEQIRGQ